MDLDAHWSLAEVRRRAAELYKITLGETNDEIDATKEVIDYLGSAATLFSAITDSALKLKTEGLEDPFISLDDLAKAMGLDTNAIIGVVTALRAREMTLTAITEIFENRLAELESQGRLLSSDLERISKQG